MRVLASLSGDLRLRRFFENNRDIHREVYALMTRKAVELVTDSERRVRSNVRHGGTGAVENSQMLC